jgi:hypothetical protein
VIVDEFGVGAAEKKKNEYEFYNSCFFLKRGGDKQEIEGGFQAQECRQTTGLAPLHSLQELLLSLKASMFCFRPSLPWQ